jgi:hypothetical protein
MRTVAPDFHVAMQGKIAAISDFANKKNKNKNDTIHDMDIIEPVTVHNVKLFDNAIRFDFLLEFVANDEFTADFGCLIEADVVIRTSYVAKELVRLQPEFAHVQHHWGHVDFEAQNVGVLCVSARRPVPPRSDGCAA